MIGKFLRLALLTTIFFSVAAAAAEEEFTTGVVGAARSGYWIGAYSFGPDANGDLALLKYDNADALVFAKPYGPSQGFNDANFYRIVPLHDGGAIVIGQSTTGFDGIAAGYSLHRVDATGAPVWSLSGLNASYFTNDNFQTQGTVLLGIDNSGGVWFPANGHIYRISSAGTLTDFGQASSSSDETYAAAVDPVSGNLYFATPADTDLLSPAQILRYTTSGTKTSIWTAPDAATRPQFLTVGTDGNLYAVGNNSSTHIAFSLTSSGTTRWSTTFGSSLYGFSTFAGMATQFAAFPDGSTVALDTSSMLYHVSATGQIETLQNDGYETSVVDGEDTSIGVTVQGDVVLSRLGASVLRVSSVSGQIISVIDSGGFGIPPTVLADGSVLMYSATPGGIDVQHISPQGVQLATTPDLVVSTAAPAQTRVDQIGLDGAWFASAEGGQGFTIDYIAAANVMFIPWFTYSVDPVSDTSGLAWVTFQGSPTPGATSATLQIARSNPGVFNSGGVAGVVIGSAVLTATDCSNARLQYQFDADEFDGIGGYIPLTRLSPSTTPCVEANGQTTPPQNANASLHGFDADQSGSWFDPDTGGQGIELTIIPAGNGSSGLVFGAWFTFDAPPANDSLHEHWFTLQGDMSTALNGTVTVPIIQSVGGSLDSLPSTFYAQVGTVTLSMLSCTSATMSYSFNNSTAAKSFANLSGSINLTKIGGCVTP
ncbi:MAG TPA: hypothetical protein VH082_09205 [Rudaea sp.]|jgi:hypothetical protein|nr:hypothetical protein [Rudaea sp.]